MEQSHVHERLGEPAIKFLNRLGDYLETGIPFYYFGSILRSDYIAGASDIDVDIFTDNENQTVFRLVQKLRKSLRDVRKTAWILPDGTTTYGYKVQHSLDNHNATTFEFSIYNSRFKEKVLREHRLKMVLPTHVTIFLRILKLFFYQLNWISARRYTAAKRFLLSEGLGYSEDKFLVWN